MKSTLYLLSLFFLFGCQGSTAEKNRKQKRIYFPYAAHYTDEYAPGKQELSKKVLDLWRAFDRGHLTPFSGYFASHIKLTSPSYEIKGSRDSIIKLWQIRRDSLTNVQSFVDSWLPVRAIERNEQVVFIWARQVRTDRQGKQSWISVHQIWRFNKQEEIYSMHEYQSLYPSEP